MDKYAGPSEALSEAMTSMAQNTMSNKMSKRKPKGVVSYDMEPIKLKATDAQMRDYERNKPVNTPAGRARYADKAPKINIRKAYQE
jgi:hypothetical protein